MANQEQQSWWMQETADQTDIEDIVDRLMRSGEDAFQRHHSLGMWKFHLEAAAEIKRLREENAALKRLTTGQP